MSKNYFNNRILALAIIMVMLLVTTPADAQKKRTRTTTRTTKTTATATPKMGLPATNYYQKAVNGDAEAQFELAMCYYFHYGVAEDNSKAMEWAKKSAAQGFPEASELVGRMYEYGNGVTKDMDEANKWYDKAFDQANLTTSFAEASPLNKARVWYTQYILYRKENNIDMATIMLEEAADGGYARAQDALGQCYSNGEGVTKDYAEAVKWYRKAAEQGNVNAQSNMGNRYYNGEGVTKDYAEAVKWYRKAAEQGHGYAQYSLGWCYLHGEGVAKNTAIGNQWMQKAADNGNDNAIRYLQEDKRSKIISEIGETTFNNLENRKFTAGMSWASFIKYGKNVSTISSRWSRVVAEPMSEYLMQKIFNALSPSKKARYRGAKIYEVQFRQRDSHYVWNYMVVVQNGKIIEWELQ